MPDYARLAASALRMITAAGAPIKLVRNLVDDYDPSRGSSDTIADQSWTGVGVRDNYSLKDIDGTLIQAGDVRIYLVITLDGSMPKTGDILMLDDGAWNVQHCTPIKPASTVLLYDVQARK